MSNHTNTKSAARTKRAGYSQETSDLAGAWLGYRDNPDCRRARDHLALRLDEVFKSRLPNGRYGGILTGCEEDVRQEACLLAISNYLAGNPGLMVATADRCLEEIDRQIRKSVNGSIKTAFRALLKTLARHHALHDYGADPDTVRQANCDHPAQRRLLWELPFEVQRRIVLTCLRSAAAEKLLSARSADTAIAMVKMGLSQTAMAKKLGVTRQAINERIAPVRKLIAALVEAQEFPLT
ncbi:MAG: hypothetical protein WCH98_01495 [Verrucomicrobiota bacterium]